MYSLLAAVFVGCLLRAFQPSGLRWAAAAGIGLGLAAATKTSAPLLVILAVAYAAFCTWQGQGGPLQLDSAFARLGILLGAGLLVFLVFVAPGAYIDAIRHPVDTGYQNLSAAFLLGHLWRQRAWLGGVALYLWTPPVLLAACGGLAVIAARLWRAERWQRVRPPDALLVLWLATSGPLLFLHLAGLSGEHGYLAFVVPVSLLAAHGAEALPRRWLVSALVVILLAMLPATILYGQRLAPVPYNSYLNNVDVLPTPTP
jgi:4-amino-4-deoxy-L-arabinose transferase-like glycosyltransferase